MSPKTLELQYDTKSFLKQIKFDNKLCFKKLTAHYLKYPTEIFCQLTDIVKYKLG